MASRNKLVRPQDAMFLWGETPETKMHVASLTIYTPPEDAGPTYLRDLHAEMRSAPVEAPWTLKLSHPRVLMHPLQSWVEDEDFDLDYHVRRSALASPGDERELGVLVSRLHSHQLDFSRPPWELHVIEGLEGGRFATYIKVHHALVDGYTGTQIFSRAMAKDPDDRTHPFFFSLPNQRRAPMPKESRTLAQQVVDSVAKPVAGAAKVAAGIAGAGASTAKAIARLETSGKEEATTPHSAPDTILQRSTGRNRRFATQQYEMDRLKRLSRVSGGTLNDVVMAICGSALRRFLLEQGELPRKPLVAFMPVNLREEGAEGGGNMVGALLASMGTHLADPKQALASVIRSTSRAKDQMRGMKQGAALAYSGYLLAPGAAQVLAAMAGLKTNPLPTTFNVVLSNVPGPRETRYLRGSRVEAYYPVSIPVHGVALNITLQSYAGTLNFGFVGCRDAVPSLQKLAVYTGEALAALEESYADELAALDAAPTGRASTASAAKATTAVEAGRPAAKKAPAEKTGAKKAPARKTGTKKSSADKASPRKAPAKKASPRKAPAKRATTTKRAPARKSTARKSTGRKSAS